MAYSSVILSTHAFIPKAELRRPLEELRRSFTLVSRFESKMELPIYKETEDYFGVPLHHTNLAPHCRKIVDQRVTGEPIEMRMSANFTPRDNQRELVELFRKKAAAGGTGFLLSLPTGYGKTVLAIRMLAELGRVALVIVPRQHLVQQWTERILQFTDLERKDIGIAQQDICDYRGRKIVLGMIHSICKDKYPEDFKKHFGVVIWDEVHVAGAESFSKTISMFPSRYRLGMSATIARKDGLENVYMYALGENVLGQTRVETLLRPKVCFSLYAAKKKQDWINGMLDAMHRRGKLISALARDRARNRLISQWARILLATGRRIVIFSDRIEQLEALAKLLDGENIGLFTGSTKKADRERILGESGIILATYGVMGMGIDVPDLRGVIFATPVSDVAQATGRILRICRDEKEPVVIDIIDTAYEDCLQWAQRRQAYYESTARAELRTCESPDSAGLD